MRFEQLMESGLKCRKFLAEESASKLILGVQVLAGRLPLPHSLPSKTQNQGDSLIFPGLTHGPKKIQVKHQVSHKLHSDLPIFPEEKKQRKKKTGGRNLQTASQTKDFLNKQVTPPRVACHESSLSFSQFTALGQRSQHMLAKN